MRQKITKRIVDSLEGSSGKPVFLWDTEVTGFGCKVLRTSKVYIFQYRPHPGGRNIPKKRITIGKHGPLTADQARKIASELLLEVRSGNDPRKRQVEKEAAKRQPTMADLAERFLTEYLPSKKRPPRKKTLREYVRLFEAVILPRLGGQTVAEITTEDIEKLHQALRKTPYQANRVLALLHQAFNQAEKWGWRAGATNPALHIDRYPEAKRGRSKNVMLSSRQMAELLQAIDDEEAEGGSPLACSAIRVAFWTGWRIGEVLGLRWEHLDLEQGFAKLLQTKTAHEEYRQLPVEAIEVLRGVERMAGSPFVFPGSDITKPLTTVKWPWEKIRKRAGLDALPGLGAFRLHDLRHNVVSWDVSRGVALEIAGKNVGHRSRQSTEVYAHFAPDALKRAADDRAKAMREAMEGVGKGRSDGSREGTPS